MKKMNKEWHQKNRMPINPTLEQRIVWHIEHQKNCTCRGVPKSLQNYVLKENPRGRNREV